MLNTDIASRKHSRHIRLARRNTFSPSPTPGGSDQWQRAAGHRHSRCLHRRRDRGQGNAAARAHRISTRLLGVLPGAFPKSANAFIIAPIDKVEGELIPMAHDQPYQFAMPRHVIGCVVNPGVSAGDRFSQLGDD